MTEEKKKPEVVFMPGCFDSFEGTQEELDEMIAEIQRMAETGELFEKSQPVDIDSVLEEFTDEEIEEILNEIEVESITKRTLQ